MPSKSVILRVYPEVYSKYREFCKEGDQLYLNNLKILLKEGLKNNKN